MEDGRRYLYNGVLSFLGGLTDLRSLDAAWSVTKMYYSAFYTARAALSRSGLVIFHVPKYGAQGHTQYEIRAFAGERASVAHRIPSTHKLVAARFQEMGYPPFMRSLVIGGSDPLMWLMEQREFWQYRSGRFPDPDIPDILGQIHVGKIQRNLAAYSEDKLGIYLADPAHAIVALPFRLVTWSLHAQPLLDSGVVTSGDISHLRKRCLVGKQMITAISRHLQ